MSRQRRERQGRAAESVAELLLRLKGYRVQARRYSSAVGEIDLVARRGDLLVFVEVKRRPAVATALEAVLPRQQARIARAAHHFLQQRPQLAGCSCRFDVIAVAPWRWPVHLEDVWRET